MRPTLHSISPDMCPSTEPCISLHNGALDLQSVSPAHAKALHSLHHGHVSVDGELGPSFALLTLGESQIVNQLFLLWDNIVYRFFRNPSTDFIR